MCALSNMWSEWRRRRYVPVELLRQPVTLTETPSLPHCHLRSVGIGVEVDRCVIDRGLWDIRLGGRGGCPSGWRGGIR